MTIRFVATRLLASALLLPLAACSPPDQPGNATAASASTPAPASSSFLAAKVRQGIDEAKQQIQTQNIDITSTNVNLNGRRLLRVPDDLPKTQITPQGELLIAGKPVAATPAQHAQLLAYRQQLIGVIEAGMDIGASGADVGIAAAKQAVLGAFDGASHAQIEANIKPATDRIKAAALQLCKRMPALLAAQQSLAADMPAFRPYATMTQKDVDDCDKGTDDHGKPGVAVFSD